MPQGIPAVRAGQVTGDEMGRAGMAQRMWPLMRAHIPDLGQAGPCQMMEGSRREGAPRGSERQEDFAPLTTRPHVPQIPHHGRPEFLSERIDLRTVLLGTPNRELCMRPIELIDAQCGHFPTAQPIDGA
jgi:hypothetical protein